MLGFDLAADEYVIAKCDQVRHGSAMSASPLVLTNTRLVVVAKGIFGNTKRVTAFQLSDVKVVEAGPQAIADGFSVELYLRDGVEAFRFPNKRLARSWAQSIVAAVEGHGDGPGRKDNALPGAALVADSLRDTYDAVRRNLRRPGPTRKVAGTCASCGAAISGSEGRVARCPSCGTEQGL